MPNYTTKLNLEKPLGNEFYNVLTVQNVNSDKIDANAIDTELKNDCMAGGDIKGYIEDGTQHNVGEIWLSRNTIGEFKCLVANTDTYVDVTPGAEKWVQIDDLTNGDKISELLVKKVYAGKISLPFVGGHTVIGQVVSFNYPKPANMQTLGITATAKIQTGDINADSSYPINDMSISYSYDDNNFRVSLTRDSHTNNGKEVFFTLFFG